MHDAAFEGFDRYVDWVVNELDDVRRRPAGQGSEVVLGDLVIAIVRPGRLEVRLDPIVAAAATRTPDTRASERGPGWVVFVPADADRFALDRAEAWLRSAHRHASSG